MSRTTELPVPAEHITELATSISFAHLPEFGESAPTQGLRTLFGSLQSDPHGILILWFNQVHCPYEALEL